MANKVPMPVCFMYCLCCAWAVRVKNLSVRFLQLLQAKTLSVNGSAGKMVLSYIYLVLRYVYSLSTVSLSTDVHPPSCIEKM